jgi:UDP-N-acetyl-D-mannosaminuronic acid transferase (WecB/TagA/CpsF family)
MKSNIIKILGIDFYNGQVNGVVNSLKSGGLLVVPSAPGLASIKNDITYYKSLQAADIAIADSGYMSLLWNLTHSKKVNRISGLEFLIAFFADKEVKATSDILLVNPRKKEADANLAFLNGEGFNLSDDNSYLAPMYDKSKIEDAELLALIEAKKPKYILLNLGGGVQEILGAYLKANLSYTPAIICTGAAIAFLSGQQANIPNWADKFFLGWLIRCIEKPKLYVPRYLDAFKLLAVMLQFNSNTLLAK